MADENEEPGEDATDTSAPAKKIGLMTLVKAIAFVSIIVLIELAAASMLIPSSDKTIEVANQLAAAEASKDPNATEETSSDETESKTLTTGDMREVTLGDFHVVTTDPNTGSSLNVDFELFATVLADEESEFFSLFESNSNRIREQILIAVRGTEVTDLTDPTLGLIKRKILEKTNRALGKPLLHEAIFSKFSFVER
ncbi:MAG: hypothetical protein L3J02_00700 [Henriciella sp.]|nr:hypothetical protein [Henriciella sp.]